MKRYRVSGTQRVAGHEPGDEFSASYSEAHESYLLTGGHLELVKKEPKHKGSAKRADGPDDGGDEPAASPQTTTEDDSPRRQ